MRDARCVGLPQPPFTYHVSFLVKYNDRVLPILSQKVWETFLKPIQQAQQKAPAKTLVNESAQKMDIHRTPNPNFCRNVAGNLMFKPCRVMLFDESADGLGGGRLRVGRLQLLAFDL